MKTKYLKLMAGLLLVLGIGGCDKNFSEVNSNPNATTTVTPEYMFTSAIYYGIANNCYYMFEMGAGGFIQHFATYLEVVGMGDKYYYNGQGTYPYQYFTTAYLSGLNYAQEVVDATASDTLLVNEYAIAKIWQTYLFSRITDMYGEAPYTAALKGYSEKNFAAVYDSQETIYKGMLNTLDSAASILDANKKTFGTGDLIYSGSVANWKKFAYSLMLRLGMRLTKVSTTMAETYVKKAIAGGIIDDQASVAKVTYILGQIINENPISYELRSNNYSPNLLGTSNTEGGKLSRTFIDAMKSDKDPRLNSIAVVYKNGLEDSTTSLQYGMKNGLASRPDSFALYSQPNTSTILSLDAPFIVLSNAETNFLLAEAAVRGWYSGDANALYQSAITASMSNMSLYGTAASISTSRINTYLSSHSLGTDSETQLKNIASQMWVALFPDELEVYSNWRRTGYPVLIPVNYTGNVTNGTIPRRFIYPPSESSNNTVNYNAAIASQGADAFTTRIWWDVQ